ncbi:dihydrofolate reductase [Streptomyces decoyicus]
MPEDMAHFKATTLGHPVVMGRKTWDSLPPRFRPLDGRRNIVVTRDPLWMAEGAERAGSIAKALELAGEPLEPATPTAAWVIGGGEIYRGALEYATTLSVTEVESTVNGDTYAPTLGPTWILAEGKGWQPSKSGLRYRIRKYTRR